MVSNDTVHWKKTARYAYMMISASESKVSNDKRGGIFIGFVVILINMICISTWIMKQTIVKFATNSSVRFFGVFRYICRNGF